MSANSYTDSRLISFTTSGSFSGSATLAPAAATNKPYDLITFLGIAQSLNIDFLPISWDVGQAIGQGGTAEISQSSVNLETAFAFKRLSSVNSALSEAQQATIFSALIAEVFVLGHKSIRGHGNINRLEGICWDIESESGRVWPVFVFEKARHGDLKTFMEHGAGTSLDLGKRLRLCAEVATAVSNLHLSGIIHGDIKPANVLVFANVPRHYTARVVDFGYSTWFGGTDDAVLMPRTQHWTAPEWHHRPMHSSSAIKMDIYSFGLLCLWLLFYHGGETEGRDFYKDLGSGEAALILARQLVDETTFADDDIVKSNLYQLFALSLAIDPAERCSSLGQLVSLLKRDRIPNPHNVEMIENDLEMSKRICSNMNVSSSIYPLYRSDHRVRTYIAACLEIRVVAHSATTLASRRAAFELSFCYTFGFGVKKDNMKVPALLKQAARSQGELTYEIDQVRYGRSRPPPRHGIYNLSVYQGHNLGRSTIGYRYNLDQGNLDEAVSRLRTEVADVESIVGVDHQISRLLKSTLSTVLIVQKKWEEAQILELQNLQQSSEALGVTHPDTLSTMSSLALIYAKRKMWKEAELLQRQAVTASLLEVGLDASVTLNKV